MGALASFGLSPLLAQNSLDVLLWLALPVVLVLACNHFQDARIFLGETDGGDETTLGQRGRQRAILREGVYAINLALFIVITEDNVYRLPQQERREVETLMSWHKQLQQIDGFS